MSDRLRPLLGVLIALLLVAALPSPAPAAPAASPTSAEPVDSRAPLTTWPTADEAHAALGRGVQVVTPVTNWGSPGEDIDAATGAAVAVAGGFDSVRYAVPFPAAAGPGPTYEIDPAFLAAMDADLDVFLGAGLTVVLEYVGGIDSEERFLALWTQIAEHVAGRPPQLYLELANEPLWEGGGLIPDFSTDNVLGPDDWNPLVAATLPVVRGSNPERTVVVTAPDIAHPQAVPSLELPDDEHLVVTFHQYQPLEFTHQGAGWLPGADEWLGTTWSGTDAEVAALAATMEPAVCWSRATGHPLWMSEFGTLHFADLASRAAWTRAAASLAEAEDITWSYFELSSDGFGIWDRHLGVWRAELFEALMGDRPDLAPWADCSTEALPPPPVGACAPSAVPQPSGLPLITDPATIEITSAPTPFEPTIEAHAGGTLADRTADVSASIRLDLPELVRSTLEDRVRPIVEDRYGVGLARTAWVTMDLDEIVATLPAPTGGAVIDAEVVASTHPVDLEVVDGGLVLEVAPLSLDSRSLGTPLEIELRTRVDVSTPTALALPPSDLRFDLDLGLGVSFFDKPIEGHLVGPWSCAVGGAAVTWDEIPTAPTSAPGPSEIEATPIAHAVPLAPTFTG